MPSPGLITSFHMPGGNGIRVDTHAYSGYFVPQFYDSMIAKIIVHAPTRKEAISRMNGALNECVVEGIQTTIPFLKEILNNPKKLLIKLCSNLDIDFYTDMLSWSKGGIKEDGVWAKHWYKNVHESTGFVKQKTSNRELPKHCEPLYFDALKYYDKLSINSIKV